MDKSRNERLPTPEDLQVVALVRAHVPFVSTAFVAAQLNLRRAAAACRLHRAWHRGLIDHVGRSLWASLPTATKTTEDSMPSG